MDPLSISMAVITVADAALGVGKALFGLYTSSKDVDDAVRGMKSGVTRIEELCRHIDKHIKLFPEAGSDNTDNQDLYKGIEAQLSDCSTLFQRINSKLEPLTNPASGTMMHIRKQWRLDMQQEDINECRNQINSNAQNLQISLQLVNLQATYLAPRLANRDLLEKLKEIQASLKAYGIDERLQACAGVYINKGTTLYTTSVASSVGDWQNTSHPQAVADWLSQMSSLRIHETSAGISSPSDDDFFSSLSQSEQTEEIDTTNIAKPTLSASNPVQDEEDEFALEVVEAAIKTGRQAYDHENYSETEKLLKECLVLIQQLPRALQQRFDLEEIHLILALCAYHNHDLDAAEAALISTLEREVISEVHAKLRFIAAESLAIVYIRLGKHDLARFTCENVYRGRRKLLGKDDESCHDILALLVRTYELQHLSPRADIYRSMIPEDRRDKFCDRYKHLSCEISQPTPSQLNTPAQQSNTKLDVKEFSILVGKSPQTFIFSSKMDSLALSNREFASIKLYGLQSGTESHTLLIQDETAATTISYEKNGPRLASGHGGFWRAGTFSTHYKPLSIYVWNSSTGVRLRKVDVTSRRTSLKMTDLRFCDEKLYFLCQHGPGTPTKGDSLPSFMVVGLDGSIIQKIVGIFESFKLNNEGSQLILQKEDTFKVLDTKNYTVLRTIHRTPRMCDVICTADGAITILYQSGKLETRIGDQVKVQWLTVQANASDSHWDRLHYTPEGNIIATMELEWFRKCVAAIQQELWIQIEPHQRLGFDASWWTDFVESLCIDEDGKRLLVVEHSGPNVVIRVLDLQKQLASGQKLVIRDADSI